MIRTNPLRHALALTVVLFTLACADRPSLAQDVTPPTVTITSPTTPAQPPAAGSTLPVSGGNYFLQGINYPWRNYGRDFGVNSWGRVGVGSSGNAGYASDFSDMQAKGVHVVRWWVFSDGRAGITFAADGTPTGLDAYVLADFDAALAIARARNIYLVPSFFDFMFLYRASFTNGVQMGGHTDCFNTPAKTTALLNNVIKPIIQRYANDPYILAWEIMNEPEWVISNIPQPSVDGSSTPVTMAQFWGVASQISSLVHTYSRAYVTVGSACLKWNKIWTNAFADRKGLPRLNIDFYQCHYYSWMNGLSVTNDPDLGTVNFSPLVQTYSALGLDRPIVVGECGLAAGSSLTWLNTFLANGYAGVWPWDYKFNPIDWTTFTSWEASHAGQTRIPGPLGNSVATVTVTSTPVALAGNASDNVGVTSVSFDNAATGLGGTATGTTTWGASVAVQPGSNLVTVSARDAAGNSGSTAITIVYQTSSDTTPPTCALTAPAAGSTLSGTSTLSATATDNVAVTRVEFHVDGTLRGTDTTAPYSFGLDTTSLSNGAHSLTAKAFDAAGNSTTSSAISVTVSNTGSTGTTPADESRSSSRKKSRCGLLGVEWLLLLALARFRRQRNAV